jgi:SM-20-related protein
MLNTSLLMDSLVEKDWFYQQNVLSPSAVTLLRNECDNRVLRKASIGINKITNSEIRSDSISWLGENETHPEVKSYQTMLDEIRINLNQELYLGLKEHEVHFAKYEKGSFYKKHKDNFKSSNKRVVTFITYLNNNWVESDGGQLRLYEDNKFTDITPIGGSIICFISEKVEHEVLMSNNDRYSLTGWFLRN